MDKDSDLLHTFVAVVMIVPVFMFYGFIAVEFVGYHPQPERYIIQAMSPEALAKACSAFAKQVY